MSLQNKVLVDPEARRVYEEELLYGNATDTIDALLESLDVSQSELASRLGVSEGRVSQLLSGRTNLTLRSLASLAWALGMRASVVIEPVSNRAGTPATDDPPAPPWLARLAPTAGIRFSGTTRAMPGAGELATGQRHVMRSDGPAAEVA
jgi:transcriptional regulator with XRE-family HTH domain